MYINIITIDPVFYNYFLNDKVMKKSIVSDKFSINFFNPRFFLSKNDKNINDKIYGGFPGLIIKPEPIYLCIKHVKTFYKNSLFVYLTPQGVLLNYDIIFNLLKYSSITLICGRYSGIDQRIIDNYVDLELSIGNYILSSGEIASLVLINSLVRYIPGFFDNIKSRDNDSFFYNNGMLSCPHYTKPRLFNGFKVPNILLSGNHKKIDKWRIKKSIDNTLKKKPFLLNFKK